MSKEDSEVVAIDSDSEKAVWDPLALHRWHDKRQKVESSAVAGKESSAVADNGCMRRPSGLQISGCMVLMEVREREAEEWVRGSCCMVPMESRQKEDQEVSSQATTLQFGSPGKRRWEEYVCPGYPHCENFDCDLCDNPSETEVEDYMDWHAKEDEMLNTAPFGTGQYLRNEVRKYHLRRKRKEANDAKLGKGKGRSGGRAAPKKGKGKGTSKGKSTEAHELKSCDTGTLRYKADVPLHARRGARVAQRDNLIRSGGSDSD